MVKGDTGGYLTLRQNRELWRIAGDIDCHGIGKNMRIDSRMFSPQKSPRAGLLGLALGFLAACGGAGLQPVTPAPGGASAPGGSAAAPGSQPRPAARPSDPFAVPASPRDDAAADSAASSAPLSLDAWQKARTAKGVAPSPPSCAAYANRAPSKEATDAVRTFGEKDPAKRDALLVALGKQPGASLVATNVMRADLAPVECADTIVDPLLVAFTAKPPATAAPASATSAGDAPDFVRLAVGFSLAGKLARTASAAPPMGAIRDKEKVKAFVGGPLKTWLLEQSTAIELLSSGAAGLSGYARGVAAIEAGIAELRLVDKMRSAPVPAAWDAELKAVYEAALDEALEPRKKRGRDAALVGMSDFARVGILRDARLDRARALLSKLYGGRRIDALDGLMVPVPNAPPAATPSDAAIENVPTFWLDTSLVGHAEDAHALSRGVTRGLRERFRKVPEGAADDLRTPYARARLDMGRVYWRRVDFVEAAHAAKSSAKPEDRLVLAVSLALAQGPNGAAEMMRAKTPAELGLQHTEALDALVSEGGPLAGMAAFDAAHLRALSPPDIDDAVVAAYLKDVAARFRKAESLLVDAAQKKIAAQRAAEIDAILGAMEKKTK